MGRTYMYIHVGGPETAWGQRRCGCAAHLSQSVSIVHNSSCGGPSKHRLGQRPNESRTSRRDLGQLLVVRKNGQRRPDERPDLEGNETRKMRKCQHCGFSGKTDIFLPIFGACCTCTQGRADARKLRSGGRKVAWWHSASAAHAPKMPLSGGCLGLRARSTPESPE